MAAGASKVIIVGQGYVGLPVAMRAVEVGYDVVVASRPGLEDGKTQELTAEMEELLVLGRLVRR